MTLKPKLRLTERTQLRMLKRAQRLELQSKTANIVSGIRGKYVQPRSWHLALSLTPGIAYKCWGSWQDYPSVHSEQSLSSYSQSAPIQSKLSTRCSIAPCSSSPPWLSLRSPPRPSLSLRHPPQLPPATATLVLFSAATRCKT